MRAYVFVNVKAGKAKLVAIAGFGGPEGTTSLASIRYRWSVFSFRVIPTMRAALRAFSHTCVAVRM